MQIVRVLSNAKGGVSVLLGAKTIIVGDNETGKSAVINAVELALTGRASDIYGRVTVAEGGMLSLLAPPDAPLFAQVEFDDGSRCRWEAEKGKKSAKPRYFDAQGLEKEPPFNPAHVLPLRPLSEAILGSEDTAREFFLRFAAGQLTRRDVLGRIPETLHPLLTDATHSAKESDPAVDKLLLALEVSEKRAREAKARVKSANETSEQVGQGLGADPTDADLDAAKAKLADAKTVLGHCQREKGKVESAKAMPSLLNQQESLRAEKADLLAKWQEQHARVWAALQELPPALPEDGMPRAETLTVMAWHAQCQPGACNVCGNLTVAPGLFAHRHAIGSAMANDRLTQQQRRAGLEAALQEAQTNVPRLQQDVAGHDTVIAQYREAMAAGDQQAAQVQANLDEAQKRADEAEKNLRDLEGLRHLWASSRRARDTAIAAEKEQQEWARLADALKDAIKDFLDKGVDRLAQWVQMRLPPGDKFVLKMRDGKKALFKFGLERDGHVHVALSGGTWARVMAAMADVCRDEGYACIIPEDRGFTPRTLDAALFGLSSAASQVLMASTTRPANLPQGWTLVDADKGEHRPGPSAGMPPDNFYSARAPSVLP